MPVLPEEHALPGAEGAAASCHRDAQGGLGERRSDVRGHVVWPLGGVDEERVPVGNETLEESIEVSLNVGIGVLVDDQRGARVVYEHRAQALGDTGSDNGLLDAVGNLHGASASRVDGERVGMHAHDSVTLIHITA